MGSFCFLLFDISQSLFFHLPFDDPICALEHANEYLASNGYVLIIDACDKAKRTSRPITAIDDALHLAEESQLKRGKGNRRITLDLLRAFEDENFPLRKHYKVVFSNLDAEGNILREMIRLEGQKLRKLYCNNGLLFLTLVHRTYQVPVDLSKAYDELKSYLEDDQAWTSMGMHFFVLKKIS